MKGKKLEFKSGFIQNYFLRERTREKSNQTPKIINTKTQSKTNEQEFSLVFIRIVSYITFIDHITLSIKIIIVSTAVTTPFCSYSSCVRVI